MRREEITALPMFDIYKNLRKDCSTKALFINKKPCDGTTDMKPDIMDDLNESFNENIDDNIRFFFILKVLIVWST
jgi:hypothetical protein